MKNRTTFTCLLVFACIQSLGTAWGAQSSSQQQQADRADKERQAKAMTDAIKAASDRRAGEERARIKSQIDREKARDEARSEELAAQRRQREERNNSASESESTNAKSSGSSKYSKNRSSSGCEPNLMYFSSRLYPYNDQELRIAREAILSTGIQSVIMRMKAEGISTSQASRRLIEQTRIFDDQCDQLRAAVIKIAADENKARLAMNAVDRGAALPAGWLPFNGSMTSQNLKHYILAVWARDANKETAIQVACFANVGQ